MACGGSVRRENVWLFIDVLPNKVIVENETLNNKT